MSTIADRSTQYTRVVRDEGNPKALAVLAEVFELRPPTRLAGLGFISQRALKLRSQLSAFDAELRYELTGVRVADPKACQCGEVLKGRDQAAGVQGVRHRLHAGDPDRHVHGAVGGRVRGVVQLRAPPP